VINIPIEIGDVILTGKFKNHKVTVKEIGLDDYGLPTVNGKGIMKVRVEKLIPKKVQESTMKNIQEGPATNDPKIQRLVDGINKVIASAIDSDGDPIPVVDNSSTWEEPVIYEPIVYKNGILKITYEQSMGGAGKSVDFIKKENMELDGIPTLRNILKMYNKAIKKNKNAKPSVGESTIKETPVNNADRILKMVTSWKKEGRAFSNVKNNDNAFFKAIKISPMKVGMTSQTGNDIIYYNTEMFDNDSDAVRNRKKTNVGESTIKENTTDKIQVVVDKHRSTPHEKLHVNKSEAEKYFAIQKQTGLIKVTSIGYDKYAIDLTQKGLDKFGLKESKKNSKMKLSEVISKGVFVTIKKEDGKFWFYIDNNGEQECISNVGFPTKEAAEHAALTKGFNVEKGGNAEDELPKTVEVPKPKAREKTPDTEKPKEIDLGKEKEIKLEEQIKKIIREEIKNFKSSYQKKKP